MIKRIVAFFIVLLLSVTFSATAQARNGLAAGANFSNLKWDWLDRALEEHGSLLSLSRALLLSQDTTGTVIILSEKVGPIIDLDERNFYKLFMGIQHFESAILLQGPDSTYRFKIITKKNDELSIKIRWRSSTEKEIARIRRHIETYGGIADQAPQSTDSTKEKSQADSIYTKRDNQQMKHIELNACVPVSTEPAIILRTCYSYKVLGIEPSLAIDSYGDYVLSGNLVLSYAINSKSWQISPFATLGYGMFFPYKSEMVNLGCGIKCRFSKSLGIRLEYIGFGGEDGAGYLGPSAGISYFL